MKTGLKIFLGATLFLFCNLLANAQTIDWNNDPVTQIDPHQRLKINFSNSLKTPTQTDIVQVHFKCTPAGNQPTNTIHSVWVGGQELVQDDGGYIPLSNLHKQGYEFVEDMGSLYLKNRSKNTYFMLGTLGPKGSCSWEEKSISSVQLNQTIETTIQTGPADSCRSMEADSDIAYYKTAKMTITFNDISEKGREVTLQSTVETTLTKNLNECEQAPLGNIHKVYPAPNYGCPSGTGYYPPDGPDNQEGECVPNS